MTRHPRQPKPDRSEEFQSHAMPTPASLWRHDGKARATVPVPVPKDAPLQHKGYMAAVRQTECKHCRWYREGEMQFCHADILGRGGKGKGIKSDCRLGYSGCAPCHYAVGTAGIYTKAERHALEAKWGAEQREEVKAAGLWPASLPMWEDSTGADGATT